MVVSTDVAVLMNRLAAQGGYDHCDLAHMSGLMSTVGGNTIEKAVNAVFLLP